MTYFTLLTISVIYNYADDNALSFIHHNLDIISDVLLKDSLYVLIFYFILFFLHLRKLILTNFKRFVLAKATCGNDLILIW